MDKIVGTILDMRSMAPKGRVQGCASAIPPVVAKPAVRLPPGLGYIKQTTGVNSGDTVCTNNHTIMPGKAMSAHLPFEDPRAQGQTQEERLLAQLHKLAKKFDIAHEVSTTGDLIGALRKALEQAEPELNALSSVVITPSSGGLVLTGEHVVVHAVGQLLPSAASVAAEGTAAQRKTLSDLYAGLPELKKEFVKQILNSLMSGIVGFAVAKATTATQNVSTNIYNTTQNITYVVQLSPEHLCLDTLRLVQGHHGALLRQLPADNSEGIARIRRGALVVSEETEGDWTKIFYFDEKQHRVAGWVLSNELHQPIY